MGSPNSWPGRAEKGVAKIDHQKIGALPEKDHQGYKVQGSYTIAEISHQCPPEETSAKL